MSHERPCGDLEAQVAAMFAALEIEVVNLSHILGQSERDVAGDSVISRLKLGSFAKFTEFLVGPCTVPGLFALPAKWIGDAVKDKYHLSKQGHGKAGLFAFFHHGAHIGTAMFAPFHVLPTVVHDGKTPLTKKNEVAKTVTAVNVPPKEPMLLVVNTDDSRATESMLQDFNTRNVRDYTLHASRPLPTDNQGPRDLGDPRDLHLMEIKMICAKKHPSNEPLGPAFMAYIISQIGKIRSRIDGLILETVTSYGDYKSGVTALADWYGQQFGFAPAEIWVARSDGVDEYAPTSVTKIAYETPLFFVRMGGDPGNFIQAECQAFLSASTSRTQVPPKGSAVPYASRRRRDLEELQALRQQVAQQTKRLESAEADLKTADRQISETIIQSDALRDALVRARVETSNETAEVRREADYQRRLLLEKSDRHVRELEESFRAIKADADRQANELRTRVRQLEGVQRALRVALTVPRPHSPPRSRAPSLQREAPRRSRSRSPPREVARSLSLQREAPRRARSRSPPREVSRSLSLQHEAPRRPRSRSPPREVARRARSPSPRNRPSPPRAQRPSPPPPPPRKAKAKAGPRKRIDCHSPPGTVLPAGTRWGSPHQCYLLGIREEAARVPTPAKQALATLYCGKMPGKIGRGKGRRVPAREAKGARSNRCYMQGQLDTTLHV